MPAMSTRAWYDSSSCFYVDESRLRQKYFQLKSDSSKIQDTWMESVAKLRRYFCNTGGLTMKC
eukprot:742058-Amphidinium_carterae.1